MSDAKSATLKKTSENKDHVPIMDNACIVYKFLQSVIVCFAAWHQHRRSVFNMLLLLIGIHTYIHNIYYIY